MGKASNDMRVPKVAYVFSDMSGGGHNLQTFKTIIFSGVKDNCIAVSLSKGKDCSLEKKLNENNIKVFYLPLNKLKIVSSIRKLREIVTNSKCEMVHSNGLKSDWMSHYAFSEVNIKHVITLHNYLKDDAYLRMNKLKAYVAVMIQSLLLRRCKHIIACSKTLEKQMRSDNPELNIYTIQNGVDTEYFRKLDKDALRRKYGINPRKFIFISTGRMSPRKRILETGEAFLEANFDDNYELWFVGDGECFEEYKAAFSSANNIKFFGRREDIVELLNLADAFVSSSETEGLPLAVLEAISTGRYVYLSDIPQHREILEEYPSAGKLYHLGKIEELTKLLQSARDDIKKSNPVSLAGTNFDIRIMGERYKNYYMMID